MVEAERKEEERKKTEEERWGQMQESIDLLHAQIGAFDTNQQHLAAQVELTTAAVNQNTKDQLQLARQLQATSEALARLSVRQSRLESGDGDDSPRSRHGLFTNTDGNHVGTSGSRERRRTPHVPVPHRRRPRGFLGELSVVTDEVEGEISRRIVDFSRCAASYIQRPAGGWVRYRSARSTTQSGKNCLLILNRVVKKRSRKREKIVRDGAIGQLLLVLIACSSIYGNETDRLSLLEFKELGNRYRSTASIDDEGSMPCHFSRPWKLGFSSARVSFTGELNQQTCLTGQIPPSLGQLHCLQTLFLSNNTLLGTIPSFANGSRLTALWLNNNNLAGEFPDLPLGLQQLQLSSNYLTGTIPSSLGNITSLKKFICAFNSIKGNFPNEIAKLSELQILYVGSNQSAVRFPQAIMNLSNLVSLVLYSNILNGVSPFNLGNSAQSPIACNSYELLFMAASPPH
ncbi:hypothetical protein EJB05_29129, partial [Eragrostis curvula]